jgi:hypothetical protein
MCIISLKGLSIMSHLGGQGRDCTLVAVAVSFAPREEIRSSLFEDKVLSRPSHTTTAASRAQDPVKPFSEVLMPLDMEECASRIREYSVRF